MHVGLARHRLVCLIAVFMLATANVARAAGQEMRIALVVGISRYEHAEELANPRNDARAIAAALRRFKFEVEEQYDLDARGFSKALRDFGVRAGQSDVAVLYYAGHGIQVSGTNYLIPADAQLERERDLLYEAVPIRLPIGELAQARKLGVLILDACRNNPFLDKLAESGLSREQVRWGFATIDDTPGDTLVAMATRTDQLAEDGPGQHSPYAAAILRSLDIPGLELSLFFRQVRDDVMQATEGRQEPYIYGSLGAAPFYFNPQPPNRPPLLGEVGTIEVLDNARVAPMRIPLPTDPDKDTLVVRVTGLPRGGDVRIGERSVLIGDYLTPAQLAAASFRPNASLLGEAGHFEFTIIDGRGGTAAGAVPVVIKPSNRAPVVTANATWQVAPIPLRIEAPLDPDGDPLTITVTAVPERGQVRNGMTVVRVGDRLTVDALTGLTFVPDGASPGPAGVFGYTADDGRGGRTGARVALEITGSDAAPAVDPEEAVWQQIRTSMDAADYKAFLRLFGTSRHAPQARDQLERLAVAAAKEVTPTPRPDMTVAGSSTMAPPRVPEPAQPARLSGSAAADDLDPAAAGRYEAVTDANVRSEPATSGDRLSLVARGTSLQVLGRVPGANWLRVALDDGSQGYIYAPLLRMTAPAEARVTAPALPMSPPQATEPASPFPPQVASLAPPNGPARSHAASQAVRDCPDCPLMVRLPPGEFMMGSERGDSSERPVHRVTIARGFAMGVYPVTVAEWRACVVGGGCPDMPRMTNAIDSTPVHNVHWQDAQAYVTWLARKTGRRYRLPSEAEWEYAARAGTTGPYWWASEAGVFANCSNCGGLHAALTPIAVGSYKANPFGLHDMNGSVAQWVADCWTKDYRGAPDDGSAWESGTCGKRVLRGGSWRSPLAEITSTARNFYDHDVRYLNNGFRVVRDVR